MTKQPRSLSFLNNTLRVLLIDDDPLQGKFLGDLLSMIPLFSYDYCSCCSDAEELLARVHFHVIILDLGIPDRNGDEFYILKKYGTRTPVIVYTACASADKGAECNKLGAARVCDKSVCGEIDNFVHMVYRYAMTGYLLRFHGACATEPAIKTCDALLDALPQRVTEWASRMKITETRLREICTDSYKLKPKHCICMTNLYEYAFRDQAIPAGFLDAAARVPFPRDHLDYYFRNMATTTCNV